MSLNQSPIATMRLRNRRHTFFNFLLFSGMGCFSYLFLVIYSDLQQKTSADLTSPWAFVAVTLAFNCIGYCLMLINHWWEKGDLYLSGQRKQLIVHYILMAVLLLLLNYLLLFSVKWMIDVPRPWHFNFSGIRMLLTIWLVELVVVSLTMANNFYRHVIVLYRKNVKLEESSVKAQYAALQNQLNPHFLFNSLNTLISEIRYNPKNAELFTQHLSDVYRYILQCQEQRLVTLRSELGFLDSYVFLHCVRLGHCIHVDNQIDPAWWDRKIPPLTLQLLAENVVKHNTIHSGKPMTIELLGSAEEGVLTVRNKIRPKKSAAPSSGMGLKNLSARYKLICGRDIVIENDTDCFTVVIPLLNE